MPGMTEPRELFLHELGDVLYAEQQLVKTLPKLAQEATDPELRKGLEHHVGETKGHVERLNQVFRSLDERPKAEQCPGIDGIKAEHDQFMEDEKPAPRICDLFLTGAASRTEHYEIAAYTGLVTMARALNEREAVQLLTENLREEKAALKQMEAAAKRLGKKQNGASRRTNSRQQRRAERTIA